MEVFYYNPLWNLKENKRFHRRDKTGTTYMYKELITLNGYIFFSLSFALISVSWIDLWYH